MGDQNPTPPSKPAAGSLAGRSRQLSSPRRAEAHGSAQDDDLVAESEVIETFVKYPSIIARAAGLASEI